MFADWGCTVWVLRVHNYITRRKNQSNYSWMDLCSLRRISWHI